MPHKSKENKMDDMKMDKKTKKGGKAKATAKRGKTGAGSWIAHVKKVAKMKKISYKEALKVASKTYKKK